MRSQAGVIAALKTELALLRVKGPAPPPQGVSSQAAAAAAAGAGGGGGGGGGNGGKKVPVLLPPQAFGLTVTGLLTPPGGGVPGAISTVAAARELYHQPPLKTLVAGALGRSTANTSSRIPNPALAHAQGLATARARASASATMSVAAMKSTLSPPPTTTTGSPARGGGVARK